MPAYVRLGVSVGLLWLAAGAGCEGAGLRGPQQAPAPIERRSPNAGNGTGSGTANDFPNGGAPHRGFPGPRGEHLTDWISQHSNLSLQQQEQALGQEPGFRDLPLETQQRYRNRLAQLDAMNPQRRQRLLARNELMERLTPNQRAQVRGALGQLGGLPPEERKAVANTFRTLRDLPPDQRIAALNSGRMGPPLNPAQRAVLDNLLTVAPILPFPGRPMPQLNQPLPGAGQPGALQMQSPDPR